MKLLWTYRAADDLGAIQRYVERDDPLAATALIDRLIDQAERLIEMPRMGRVVPEVGHPNVRELIIDNYRLVYRIWPSKIEVLQVFEGHRLLRDLKEA